MSQVSQRILERDDDTVTVSLADLYQLLGKWGLPPWPNRQGDHILGGDVDCAPLAEQIATDIEAIIKPPFDSPKKETP